MKIQEIRIGSLIRGYYDEDGERKYRDFKVVNILGRLEEVESEEGEIFHIDDCDGIPLTEEILKANGFECPFEERTYELRNMEYSIYVCFKRFCVNIQVHFREIADEAFIRVHCKSVHELQNALYDCKLYDLADNLKLE